MLLALAERCRKVADTLAAHIADRRDPLRITHTVADTLTLDMPAPQALFAARRIRSGGTPRPAWA
jgi:hypothetical protein